MILPYTSREQGWHVAHLNSTAYTASMNLKIRINYLILAGFGTCVQSSDLSITRTVGHDASAMDLLCHGPSTSMIWPIWTEMIRTLYSNSYFRS